MCFNIDSSGIHDDTSKMFINKQNMQVEIYETSRPE